jgi:hypothetical protein
MRRLNMRSWPADSTRQFWRLIAADYPGTCCGPCYCVDKCLVRTIQVLVFIDEDVIKARYVRVSRVLYNEVKREWDDLTNEHRFMENKPTSQCMAERLFGKINRESWLLVLQAGPIRFEVSDETVDSALATKLSLEVANQCVHLVIH